MDRVSESGRYQELSDRDPFSHLYESKDSDGNPNTRLFWSEDRLKFVKHREFSNVAEVIEINKEERSLNFYSVGEPDIYNGEHIELGFEEDRDETELGVILDHLENPKNKSMASEVQKEASEKLEALRTSLTQKVPTEVYIQYAES